MTFGYDPEALREEKEQRELEKQAAAIEIGVHFFRALKNLHIEEETHEWSQQVALIVEGVKLKKALLEKERQKRSKKALKGVITVDVEVDEYEEELLFLE